MITNLLKMFYKHPLLCVLEKMLEIMIDMIINDAQVQNMIPSHVITELIAFLLRESGGLDSP